MWSSRESGDLCKTKKEIKQHATSPCYNSNELKTPLSELLAKYFLLIKYPYTKKSTELNRALQKISNFLHFYFRKICKNKLEKTY